MNKTLVGLILGIGLLSGCSQKEYTKEQVFEKIEKERTFSEQEYKRYSILRIAMPGGMIIEQLFDFDRDGNIDAGAMFSAVNVTLDRYGEVIDCKIKDKAIFVGMENDGNSKFKFFYSDKGRDGILENKIDGKEIPSDIYGPEDTKELLI